MKRFNNSLPATDKIASMHTLELDDLFAILRDIEDAARSPANVTNMDRANVLALSMAKNAPTGGIANIAMQLVTVTNELRRSAQPPRIDDAALNKALSRLRLALQDERNRHSTVELQPRG